MTRCLVLTEIFPPRTGGSGRWFWEVYRRLPREAFAIATAEHPDQEVFDKTHDLQLYRLPLSLRQWGLLSLDEMRGYWRAYRAVRRVVQAEGITRLHCGRCLPEGWIALLLKYRMGIPYQCYAHGEEINLHGAEQEAGVMSSRQLRWMTRRVLRHTDRVIANSHNTAELLQGQWHVPSDRIQILHPGVDAARFVPAARNARVRNLLGWGDRPVILTVGRLQERKGHDRLIEAMASIRRVVPNALYAIAGDGVQRTALVELVQRLQLAKHIQFLGEVEEATLLHCYQQCDLFVLPNRQIGSDIEGFGMVLLEAQACGKPVLAGASGGTSETLVPGATGNLICCDDSTLLAHAVIELLQDEIRRAAMGEQARHWIVNHFDWEELSARAQQLFVEDDSHVLNALN